VTAIACAAVWAAVIALFAVVLESPNTFDRCVTTLLPSAYRDALAPAHVALAGVLSAGIVGLSAARNGDGIGRPTALALAAVWVVGLVWLAKAGALPSILAAAPAVAIAIGLRRRAGAPATREERRLAMGTATALWIALVAGVPVSVVAVYVNGSDLFCF
jgi:hypothetical protein